MQNKEQQVYTYQGHVTPAGQLTPNTTRMVNTNVYGYF